LSSTATGISLFLIHDKSKVVPLHAMKAHVKVQLQVHSFLTLAPGGGSHSWPGHFNPKERALNYPLNRRLHEPQSQAECFGKEINFFPMPRNETLFHSD